MNAIRMHETGGVDVLRIEQVDAPAPGRRRGPDPRRRRRRQLHGRHGPPGRLPHARRRAGAAGRARHRGRGRRHRRRPWRRRGASSAGGSSPSFTAATPSTPSLPWTSSPSCRPRSTSPSRSSFLVQGVTAWQLLHDCGRLQAGESVLVHSAAGGVGTLAVQLARTLGATTVVATAGSAEKCRLALELGADVALDYSEPDWPERVLEATGRPRRRHRPRRGRRRRRRAEPHLPRAVRPARGLRRRQQAPRVVRRIAADAAQPVRRRVLADQPARTGDGRRGGVARSSPSCSSWPPPGGSAAWSGTRSRSNRRRRLTGRSVTAARSARSCLTT